ncbi:Oidioi.mRNA.OKI2018_I69.chr1.g278.t1.cds [Oikopleura dioica]|uniref:Oidioi.mRNA.OKI2018_I69.chr1.g278.t1.cds n=1 Tax=Oikopleura dioica TaxID=34765 RepID=A0ABN7SJC4_OIKDI|nr:Oidioi.mRNA.OKI2018_I69.chr1.g278.t1.cds [Oikopleura dioica]
MGDHIVFQDKSKEARPTLDALFNDSKLDEMAQLIMLQQQNPPEAQETRVGFFYEDTFEGPKPNYIKLELKFNDDRTEFTGSGFHFANNQAFEVVEGAVNKKTKYWKFICAYESGRKKATGRKELVQFWGWSHGRVWCGGYHEQGHEYQDKKLQAYAEQAFIFPEHESFEFH